MGFRAIFCNRPDGAEPDQPTFAEIATAAAAPGLEPRRIPVKPDAIEAAYIAAFGHAIKELPGPVLGYCRGGLRAASLWEKSHA